MSESAGGCTKTTLSPHGALSVWCTEELSLQSLMSTSFLSDALCNRHETGINVGCARATKVNMEDKGECIIYFGNVMFCVAENRFCDKLDFNLLRPENCACKRFSQN